MDERPVTDKRKDHRKQALIDVGVALNRTYGAEYARAYLESVNLPEELIERVLMNEEVREPTRYSLRLD